MGDDRQIDFESVRRFLELARRDGTINARTLTRLRNRLVVERRLNVPPMPVAPVPSSVGVFAAPPRPDAPPIVAGWTGREVPLPVLPAATEAPPRPSSHVGAFAPPIWTPLSRRLDRWRTSLLSDLTVHGLAYLGLLLTFAGLLGFVFFAFGTVQRGLRPVAEASIPAVLAGAAWFLRTRRAPVVSTGLTLLAAALLPVAVLTTFVDRASFPPDLTGSALIVAFVISSAILAAAYAGWALRRPASPLRFLVGPLVWTAALAAGFPFRPGQLGGLDVEHPVAAQWTTSGAAAVVTLAILVLVIRRRHDGSLVSAVWTSAVPWLALAFGLTLVTASGERWAPGPILVSGVVALAGTELLARGLRPAFASPPVQATILVVCLLAIEPRLGLAVTGLICTGVAILFLERHGRSAAWTLPSALGAIGILAGLALSAARPWPSVAAWGGTVAWIHVRRATGFGRGRRAASIALTAAAATAPAGLIVMLLRVLPDERVLVATSLALAVAALAIRRRGTRDRFWGWWLPLAGVAVEVGAWGLSAGSTRGRLGVLAVAALTGAVPVAFGSFGVRIRVWIVGAVVALTTSLALGAFGVPSHIRPALWAGVGLLVVAAACVSRARSLDDAGAIGHLAGLGAIVARTSAGAHAAVLLCSAGGWLVAVVAAETNRPGVASFLQRLPLPRDPRSGRWRIARDRVGDVARAIPEVAFVATASIAAVSVVALVPILRSRIGWVSIVLAISSTAYAVAGRTLTGRRPLARVLSDGSFVVVAVALGFAASAGWSPIAAFGAMTIASPAVGRELRRRTLVWVSWAASAPLTVLLARQAGLAIDRSFVVVFAWGAAALLGAFAYEDALSRPRGPGRALRSSWLLPPVVLGAAATAASIASTFARGPHVFGWWSLAGAALSLVVALRLRWGALLLVSSALATVAFGALLPGRPIDHPWLFVPWIAALLGAAEAISQRSSDEDRAAPWRRWDLPLLVAGNAVGLIALGLAAARGTIAVVPTWGAVGALSVVLGIRRRNEWWFLSGVGIELVAAGVAGPWWSTAALAVVSGGAAGESVRRTGARRRAALAIAVLAAGGAWMSLGRSAGWTRPQMTAASALAAGLVALSTAVLFRIGRAKPDSVMAWTALAAVGTAGSALSVVAVAGRLTLSSVSGGLMLSAAAAALVAPLTRSGWPREAAAALAVGALGAGLAATQGDNGFRGVVALCVGTIAVAVSLGAWIRGKSSPWIRPMITFGAGASAIAIGLTAAAWPARSPLVAAIGLASLEAGAAGIVLSRRALIAGSVLLLCAAWVVLTSGVLSDPNWFAIPIGGAVLSFAELARSARRAAGQKAYSRDLVALEYAGIAVLMTPAIVQEVVRSSAYGLLALVLGMGILLWAAISHVRRRVVVGAATVALALVLMVAGPVARRVPAFHGPSLWLGIAAIGLVVIGVAGALERGRTRITTAARRLRSLFQGWE